MICINYIFILFYLEGGGDRQKFTYFSFIRGKLRPEMINLLFDESEKVQFDVWTLEYHRWCIAKEENKRSRSNCEGDQDVRSPSESILRKLFHMLGPHWL